ncbi:hypothetical protein [Halalkalibacter akibai]|uniref:Uncharacterized protein n=1 Tax=Halalkalibacter akibai (strain ATCC 43226 / DSM 21942 / CIP 109018 / JCM 9157 / 1139) TaxID=1236973 RepID=W4QYB5_HALA3|nr:hypothetical protein [Halalkalibacter akibai]GAE36648.1 hypothetical protein JCM9157_3850 [Halalkalibacter akibai JCM 9157]
MGSVLKASIKKIEILNKIAKDEWNQSVRIILGDIELNNDNFIALRRFRPDEIVHVTLESAQMSLFDMQPKKRATAAILGDEVKVRKKKDERDVPLVVEGGVLGEGEVVEQEFRF